MRELWGSYPGVGWKILPLREMSEFLKILDVDMVSAESLQ